MAGTVAASALWLVVLVQLAAVAAAVFIDGEPLEAVLPAILLIAALALARAGLGIASEVLAQRAATDVKAALRVRLLARLRVLGPGFVRGERSGELVHLATDGIEALDEHVARYLPARYAAGLVPVIVLVAIGLLDALTLPVLLFAGPLLVILLVLIGRQTRDLTARREREIAWMHGHFLDMLRGLPTLKLFGRSREQVAVIGDVADRLATSSLDVLRTAFQTSLVLEWGATAATALVAIETSVRLMAGDLSFERAFAVLLLTPEFFTPLRVLATRYHAKAAGAATLARIGAIEAVAIQAPLPRSWRPPPRGADIVFRDVTVHYPGRALPALDAISFSITAGTLTAISGPTGAGKSTVVALLLRFLEPDRGSIEIGDVPLEATDPVAWRRGIAWLPQGATLFAGSVLDNLRLGRPEATLADAQAAAQAAAIASVIEGLPDGYDTSVGEAGARLSGGERQRLALARALLRDAPLLLLDEPTSHLDRASAERVRATLLAERGRRTIVAISHDPEILADADAVITLEPPDLAAREPAPALVARPAAAAAMAP